ncbi:MAG: hypothetical protein R3B36_30090 [Polyangiaceae bacterium]
MSRRTSALLAFVLVSTCASASLAQPSDAPPPPAPAGAAPPAAPSAEARKHFEAGVALLQDPEGQRVEEAYREFSRSYELSHSPKVLGNMGFCAMKLERDGEAIDAYTRYLRDVPDVDADERAQILRDLQTLQVGVVRLSLKVDKPGAQIIDVRVPVKGARVTNTYTPGDGALEIGVRSGHHIVTARLPGHDDAVWEFDAYAGGKDEHTFAIRETPKAPPVGPVGAPYSTQPPPPREQRSSTTLPWVVTGVGAAMVITGGLTGVIALGKTKDIEKKCPGDVCPAGFDLDGERSSTRSLVRLTDVLLIGGALVTAGGVTWLLLSGGGGKSETAKKSNVVPSAGCSPAGCGGSVKVTF